MAAPDPRHAIATSVPFAGAITFHSRRDGRVEPGQGERMGRRSRLYPSAQAHYLLHARHDAAAPCGGDYRATGEDADEVSAIFGARMDVAVQHRRRRLDAIERLRREACGECLLGFRVAEHAIGARAGHGNPDLAPAPGHEHTDEGIARCWVAELLVSCLGGHREGDLGDDLPFLESRVEQPGEEV